MPDKHKYYKKRIFASYKVFGEGIEILTLSFFYFKFPKTMFAGFFVLILDFNGISSHFNVISLHFYSINSSQ